jgi:hypothetical protein
MILMPGFVRNVRAEIIQISDSKDIERSLFLERRPLFLMEESDLKEFNRMRIELYGADEENGRVLGYRELYSTCLAEQSRESWITPVSAIIGLSMAILVGVAIGISVERN